jgi:hypothetical protein
MSAWELRLAYLADDEWTGEIIATVTSGAFSGRGAAWFDRTNVKETFLAGLKAFPLTSASPPVLEGGFWSKKEKGKLEQCHLRITIKPHDSRGTLMVHVDVATESRRSPDAELQNCATIRFLTEYGFLDSFAAQFEQVLDGKEQVALLKGSAN